MIDATLPLFIVYGFLVGRITRTCEDKGYYKTALAVFLMFQLSMLAWLLWRVMR